MGLPPLGARGLTTTYGYSEAGDLASVDYSDATPDVAYSFDRRGRRVGSTSSLESIAWTYNEAGQPLSESHTGGPLAGATVTMGYDNLLRRTFLQSAMGTSLTTQGYSYDGASRLLTVGDAGHTVEYGYQPDTSMVHQLTFRMGAAIRMSSTRPYDGWNRLTQTTTTPSADAP